MTRRAWIGWALVGVVAACEPSAPYHPAAPEPLGPVSAELPVRLTFNPSEDRDPAATSEFIVFSRLEPSRADRDRCLAFLPLEGGTLLRTACAGGSLPNETVDAWTQPAPTNDGRIAYLRAVSSRFALTPAVREVVIAPLERPDSILVARSLGGLQFDSAPVLDLRQLTWVSGTRVRFIAGFDSITHLPGAPFDTLFRPLGLAELDVEAGVFVPRAGGAYAYAAVSGGVWFVRGGAALWFLADGDSTADSVGVFSGVPGTIAAMDGIPVAAIPSPAGGHDIEWLDPSSGVPAGFADVFPGASVQRISAIPGARRLVVEYWIGPVRVPPDLALVAVP
jgi:hypothetical protein